MGLAVEHLPKPALGLTRVQARCLEAIRDAIAREGVSPTYSELMDRLGAKSKSHIHQLVRQLEKRGAVVRRIGSARSLAVTRIGLECALVCPHCGKPRQKHKRPQDERKS